MGVAVQKDNAHELIEERDLARKQLNRVLGSKCFRRSEQLRRFLAYVAQKSLSEDAPDVKEYSIAIDILAKDESFDPRRDPIVRVEARRLRSKLKEYYATEGGDDSVTLDLQVGSYVLLFRRRVLSTAGSRSETVALKPFSVLGESRPLDRMRDALMSELVDELSRIEGLRILLWDPSRTALAPTKEPAGAKAEGKPDWIVEGGLRAERTFVRVSVRLINACCGELQWGRSWDLPPNPTFALLQSFAGSVVNSLRPLLSATLDVKRDAHVQCL